MAARRKTTALTSSNSAELLQGLSTAAASAARGSLQPGSAAATLADLRSEALDRRGSVMGGYGVAVSKPQDRLEERFNKFVKKMEAHKEDMKDRMEKQEEQLEDILDQLEEVGPRFDEIQEAIDKQAEQIEELRTAFEASNSKFDRAVLDLSDWRGALAKLAGHVRAVEQHAAHNLASVGGQLSEAVEAVEEDIAELQEACRLPGRRTSRLRKKGKDDGPSLNQQIINQLPRKPIELIEPPDANKAAEILGILPPEELDGAQKYAAGETLSDRMAKIEAELKQQIQQTSWEGQFGEGENMVLEAGKIKFPALFDEEAVARQAKMEEALVRQALGPLANQYPHLPFGTDRVPPNSMVGPQQRIPFQQQMPQGHQAVTLAQQNLQQFLVQNAPMTQPSGSPEAVTGSPVPQNIGSQQVVQQFANPMLVPQNVSQNLGSQQMVQQSTNTILAPGSTTPPVPQNIPQNMGSQQIVQQSATPILASGSGTPPVPVTAPSPAGSMPPMPPTVPGPMPPMPRGSFIAVPGTIASQQLQMGDAAAWARKRGSTTTVDAPEGALPVFRA